MVSSRDRAFVLSSLTLLVIALLTDPAETPEAHAWSAGLPPLDPDESSVTLEQGEMIHVLDTSSLAGGPYYVNDHTIVQGDDGTWHLFGIFHDEPKGSGAEVDLVHAVSDEREPARWRRGSFEVAPAPHRFALHARRELGETHLWAPHVARVGDRWVMIYQAGGADDYHASIRLAESHDLYAWTRTGALPLFEDFCEARDPMLTRRGDEWVVYYTRCESISHKASGVVFRTSPDLARWSEPHIALSVRSSPETSNSAYTESPFVFERGGTFWLSITAYPTDWAATLLYRSRAPFAFPDVPAARLRAHAAEWVFGRDGTAFMTHAGPGQTGVWISRIDGLPR